MSIRTTGASRPRGGQASAGVGVVVIGAAHEVKVTASTLAEVRQGQPAAAADELGCHDRGPRPG